MALPLDRFAMHNTKKPKSEQVIDILNAFAATNGDEVNVLASRREILALGYEPRLVNDWLGMVTNLLRNASTEERRRRLGELRSAIESAGKRE